MRRLGAVVLLVVLAFVAVAGGLVFLALVLIPQDSGVEATGEWGYSLPFFMCAAALLFLAFALWRWRD